MNENQEIRPFLMRMSHVSKSPATIIGAYGLDSARNYENGLGNIKYLNMPKTIRFNLNEGDYIDKPPLDPRARIFQLTSFIMDNENDIIKNKCVDADFVCFRGVLRFLMETPYNQERSWLIEAVKFKGTIYLCLIPTEDEINEMKNEPEYAKKFRRYGFKFESYLMSSHPQRQPPGASEVLIEAEEFCVVVSKTIGGFKIIFGNEIDGVESKHVIATVEELKKAKLVELKSRSEKQYLNTSKTLASYCQASLCDMDEIYIGIRDNWGFINEVRLMNITEEMSKNWEIPVCDNFLKNFLSSVKTHMKDIDDPYTVYRYAWNPTSPQKSVLVGRGKIDNFLPKKFVEFMNKI